MAKLTKAQRKAHGEAVAILTKTKLSDDEIQFVFENFHEGADHNTGAAGAFFTPPALARDFSLDVGGSTIVDLCAGIGALAYEAMNPYRNDVGSMVCIENNPRYVEIGRKLIPDARWICANVFDWRSLDLRHFDWAIGNPPFGRVARSGNGPTYRGPEFEYHVIDVASELADAGTFIVPQQSSAFRYSGAPYYERRIEGRAVAFSQATGLNMEAGVGVDTSIYKDEWKDTSIVCEIVCFDFEEDRTRIELEAERIRTKPAPTRSRGEQVQLTLDLLA